MGKLKITRTRSSICRSDKQIATLKHLGLHKIHQSVVLEDTAIVRGMINVVKHMVKVSPVA